MSNPQPRVWPACSNCGVAYVLRRAIVMRVEGKKVAMGEEWVWQRDCKHKKAEPVAKAAVSKRNTKVTARKPHFRVGT